MSHSYYSYDIQWFKLHLAGFNTPRTPSSHQLLIEQRFMLSHYNISPRSIIQVLSNYTGQDSYRTTHCGDSGPLWGPAGYDTVLATGSGVPRGGFGVFKPPPPRNSEDIGGVLDRTSKKNRRLDFLL